ncbi:MAG: hypothetical protein ACJ76R_15535, partial [Solirubrobacteraceae bacterium]
MPRCPIAAVAAVAGVAVAVAAVTAAPAPAATVNLTPARDSLTLRFAARPGETNDVVLDRTPSGFVVQQRSARLAAGRGCRLLERYVAFCAVAPGEARELSAEVLAGDHDDRLDIGDVAAPVDEIALDGGAGDDLLLGAGRTPKPASADGLGDLRLDGGPGRDRLVGGPARESLDGGTGADVLRGGRGDDVLTGDPAEAGRALPVFPDRLDGGKGEDVADYGLRRRAVTVDLADRRPDGQAGEGDVLRGIDDVWGGDRRNVLRGDGGRN